MFSVHFLCFAFVATVAAAVPRGRVGGVCAGCQETIDVSDPGFRAAMVFAVNAINRNSNTAYRYVPTAFANPTTQTVAGVMYRADVTLTQSTCPNNQYGRSGHCPLQTPATSVTCRVAVWWQSWRRPQHQLFQDGCTGILRGM